MSHAYGAHERRRLIPGFRIGPGGKATHDVVDLDQICRDELAENERHMRKLGLWGGREEVESYHYDQVDIIWPDETPREKKARDEEYEAEWAKDREKY